ncbi:polymeric immunoglobulin receptor-like [Halichoeres trimaculatus]|uniref:polymeric immunoglobulin receptor-like n=1 Tax=Halichoeres trimaculatus TaxID=147232 RepID=UPI003D9DF1AD
MNLHHGLICFFLLSLQDGNPGFLNAETFYQTVAEGGHAELECPSSLASTRKFLCKESCRQTDILIETEAVSAQSGRFSIEWRRRGQSLSGDVFVNMSQLTKSDSGRYRCGVGGSVSSAKYDDFEITVVDALLDEDRRETLTLYPRVTGNITVACHFYSSFKTVTDAFLCGSNCLVLPTLRTEGTYQNGRLTVRYIKFTTGGAVYVSISQLTKSDSGHYSCGFRRSGSSHLKRTFEVDVTDETSTSVPTPTPLSKDAGAPETTEQPATSTTDILLYVGGTLVALVALLSVALLIFCRRKSSKPTEPPVETEYASISEVSVRKFDPLALK